MHSGLKLKIFRVISITGIYIASLRRSSLGGESMGRQSAADQDCCGERRGRTHRQSGDRYACGRREEESGCSRFQDSRERPLGMRFPSEGTVTVTLAWYGRTV